MGHLDEVSHYNPITRRAVLEQWACGKLWATGLRVPRGGARADSFGLYAHHTTGTDEGIRALFHHVKVNSIIFQTYFCSVIVYRMLKRSLRW